MSRSLVYALLLLAGAWLPAALWPDSGSVSSCGPKAEGLTPCAPPEGLTLCAAPAHAAQSSGESPAEESASEEEQSGEGPVIDPLGPNAACYVCHMTFVGEPLSSVHQAEEITCITCHGLSAAHANDENIGATPPDVRYARGRIDAACLKCHEHHNAQARDVLARFFQRKLPARVRPVCTDCHGRHRIAAAKDGLPTPGDKPGS